MIQKREKPKKYGLTEVICGICLLLLILLMLSVFLRMFTRAVLIKHGISNAFTDAVNFDAPTLKYMDENEEIDWQQLYPFSEPDLAEQTGSSESSGHSAAHLMNYLQDKINPYVTDCLVGYHQMTEWAKRFEKLIQWNFTSYAEYNGIIEIADGYLTGITPVFDTEALQRSVCALSEDCRARGIDFLYVQTPNKICPREDASLSGTVDYSNRNFDELLSGLSDSGTAILDLRDVLHEQDLEHHSLFYRTDHHWRCEAGLWAAQELLGYLQEHASLHCDPSVLDSRNFVAEEYPDWFLGSQGKKVTLARATPEDFSLLLPLQKTSLHYQIPEEKLDLYGDFSVTYDRSQLETIDYYNGNPYNTFNYGDQALIRIENEQMPDGAKVLLLHDSFGDCVLSFMSLGVGRLDAIDLRFFTGSLKAYIEQEAPDAVIVMYSYLESLDLSTHRCMFDFR